MRLRLIRVAALLPLLTVSGAVSAVRAQQQERAPAVPLVVHNPYFSIWSMNDHLTDGPTRHWTGTPQALAGLARIDGQVFRYMGNAPRGVMAMKQVSLAIAPTHTTYMFEESGVRLTLAFFTPALLQDMDVLSRPVTYLTWTAASTDGAAHKVDVLLDVDPLIAVNTDDEEVTWGRSQEAGLAVMNVGSRDQQALNRSGDNLRIDWGYFHLAVPVSPRAQAGAQAMTAFSSTAIRDFAQDGKIAADDDMDMPRTPHDGAAHLAAELTLNCDPARSATQHVLVAYTQGYAIEYLERKLRPYWQRNGESVGQMLSDAEAQYASLDARGKKYDDELTADLKRAGGDGYAELAVLAYRQALGAHMLVADEAGRPMLFAKENFSNGDIATVDVLYPSSPFFLLLNPAMLEAQVRPVLNYASLPRWKFLFAPHDLGRYPLADGQKYGGGEKTEENQMPVEESGNLLILGAAIGQAEGDWHVAREYWPEFTKWAEYVRDKGLDPENQLCTDDFAGHLAHNANLSIKAIEGLGAYSLMARGLGEASVADDYLATAKKMAASWQQMDADGDHYKLAFDKPGTWSEKYNLVWDELLGLHLFPASVRETELKFYVAHLNEYGLPLDNRADYTKLDWELWTATLASNQSQFDALVAPIVKWMNETPSRVPLTDWYDTKTGKQQGFQARSVVGGLFIKALADKSLTQKWRDAAKAKAAGSPTQ
ncbi:MAG: glutaminase domain-containing protein [Candidatus Acidiferrales bacterium]